MKRTKIALVQTDWSGDRASMKAKLAELIGQAAAGGSNLVCLQEFTLSPYFASVLSDDNYRWAEMLHGGESDQFFGELAGRHRIYLISSIFEQGKDGKYWDTAVLHGPAGTQIGYTRKVHIPAGTGYHEDHYFGGATDYPVHDVAGLQVAAPTCYDQWFPEMSRICALNGAEFIFYPTAIGSEPSAPGFDSQKSWELVMRGQAIANGVFMAAANRVGQEGVTFYGSSFICDPMGNILAQASRDQTEIISAELDPAIFDQWRALFPLLKQRRPELYGPIMRKMT
ncbi:MAG: hypothetical protein KDE04_21660 [Anaerolineales bacterium]|nr:hypothetical protein [Anaerolineales bacterium]